MNCAFKSFFARLLLIFLVSNYIDSNQSVTAAESIQVVLSKDGFDLIFFWRKRFPCMGTMAAQEPSMLDTVYIFCRFHPGPRKSQTSVLNTTITNWERLSSFGVRQYFSGSSHPEDSYQGSPKYIKVKERVSLLPHPGQKSSWQMMSSRQAFLLFFVWITLLDYHFYRRTQWYLSSLQAGPWWSLTRLTFMVHSPRQACL